MINDNINLILGDDSEISLDYKGISVKDDEG